MEKFPLDSVDLHGAISMELHGIPCPNRKFSMEFHGVILHGSGDHTCEPKRTERSAIRQIYLPPFTQFSSSNHDVFLLKTPYQFFFPTFEACKNEEFHFQWNTKP